MDFAWRCIGCVGACLFYKRSFSDLSYFTPLGYALKILVLFVAAYITADSHPRFSSPNLVSPDSLPQERRL